MDTLYRDAREWFAWPITASDVDGQRITLTEVQVTFLARDVTPGADATYTTAPVVDGKARLLLAGPDGAGEGAVVLPIGTSIPWFRVQHGPSLVLRPGRRIVVS